MIGWESILTFASGAASGLLGGFMGAWLQSRSQETRRLKERLCTPLLEELKQVLKNENFPEESEWVNVTESTKVMLSPETRRLFEKYSNKIDSLSTSKHSVKVLEENGIDRIQGNSGIFNIYGSNNVGIAVDIRDPNGKTTSRFKTVPITEFIDTAPDFAKIAKENQDSSLREIIKSWVESDDCPYQNASFAMNEADANWATTLAKGYKNNIFQQYPRALTAREHLKVDSYSLATECRYILENIMNRRF
jgi:hypothetical protein